MGIQTSIFSPVHNSVGNVTFRRMKNAMNKVQSISSQKIVNQTNPKTQSQMRQRARFATAVKFYKRATKNFFKFAFEDQKPNESDYNAFMRHNTAAAGMMNKFQVNSEHYPAVGNPWQLSLGSLTPITVTYDSETTGWVLDLTPTSDFVPQTVQELSALFRSHGYQDGDIVTIVKVDTGITAAALTASTAEEVSAQAASNPSTPVWTICQFIISSTNTAALADLPYIGKYTLTQLLKVNLGTSRSLAIVDSDQSKGAVVAVVVTRKNGRKLFATSSYMVGNTVYKNMVQALTGDDYTNGMLTSWGASSDSAILKGGVVSGEESSDSYPVIKSVNDVSVPAKMSYSSAVQELTLNLVGTGFNSEHELSENSFSFDPSTATVKSFKINSDTSATLAVSVPASYQGTLYCTMSSSTSYSIARWIDDETSA